MGKVLVLTTVAFACIAIGSALQCLHCKFTIFNLPCHTSVVTCNPGQVCAIIRGTAIGKQLVKKKNCVPEEKCHKNDTETFANTKYITTYECCEGEFCNSGATLPSAPFALPVVLAALGTWLTRFL